MKQDFLDEGTTNDRLTNQISSQANSSDDQGTGTADDGQENSFPIFLIEAGKKREKGTPKAYLNSGGNTAISLDLR